MNQHSKTLIRHRAERIGRLAGRNLMENGDDDEACEAFKYAYLALRGPKSFLGQFDDGGSLIISPRSVATFMWRHQDELFGRDNIDQLPDELNLIKFHNEQVHLRSQYAPYQYRHHPVATLTAERKLDTYDRQ
jgi:hypothetical protein